MHTLETTINAAYEQRDTLNPANPNPSYKDAVAKVIAALNTGSMRVAEKINGNWHTHEWIKKAVLLHFRLNENVSGNSGFSQYYDKVKLKYADYTLEQFKKDQVRIVPPACVREGAYVAPNCVLMPSFVNIGAYVDSGSMIDTWATVGSCVQIGKNVHISGGVGIGGVLEPLQATPTIIEDDCFIGARSEVVEGVIIEQGSVLSMGVFIGQSTKIYDRQRDEVFYGRVPAYSVVVPGAMPGSDGRCQLACAVIIKTVDAKTRSKVGINHLLRETANV